MVKRILLSIVMLALIAYLIVAITAFNRKPADQTCRDMELVIKDTAYAGFITKDELKGILQQKGIYPIGKKMERISTKSLERELSKHPLINGIKEASGNIGQVAKIAALCGDEDAPPTGLFVTPQDIDRRVRELGRLIGYGVTLALQPGLTPEDAAALLG